ncbi:MAG: prenyltransferase [Coriobacteriaceae bacterium]|jgi:1,4-dihydroxy-2-naphthoate octaprenyltransferase|nr:prenyltransferase [Coriobacteriaceae bacterium]
MQENPQDTSFQGSLQNEKPTYASLSPKLALQLAAPHTWPAAIIPVLFAVALASVSQGFISVSLALALLCISILMQATANTLNDYFDFKKGADSLENQKDPTDAVLVYNKVNPTSVLFLAVGFVACAAALGLYVIVCAGWIPLAIGFIGAAIIVLYSAGKTPLSYLPLGEVISGITMGYLIALASYQALTGIFSLEMLWLSLPLVVGIGLIMFTNNLCDIEKDIQAGRKTLPVLLGRARARKVYQGALVGWIVLIGLLVALFFTAGLLVVGFMLIILYPLLSTLWKNPFIFETRAPAMASCLNANIGLGVFYILAILFSSVVHVIF